MRRTVADHRANQRPWGIELRGMVRRVVIAAARASGLWQLRGYKGIDEEDEPFENVEVFQGIGFSSRPKSSGKPEAILVQVGGRAGNAVVVATRDKTLPLALDEDETAIMNSLRTVLVNKLGHVLLGKNAVQALVMGTAYRSAEATMHASIQSAHATFSAAVVTWGLAFAAWIAVAQPHAPPVPAAGTDQTFLVATAAFITAWGVYNAAVASAITTFEASASSYLSTVSKTE